MKRVCGGLASGVLWALQLGFELASFAADILAGKCKNARWAVRRWAGLDD
jgi:hypothetical protein